MIRLTFFLLFIAQMASAQKSTAPAPQGKANVLDFEGDVIEGEKARPDLFLDIKSDDFKMDDVIFMRKNFDDFYQTDRKNRPKFTK